MHKNGTVPLKFKVEIVSSLGANNIIEVEEHLVKASGV